MDQLAYYWLLLIFAGYADWTKQAETTSINTETLSLPWFDINQQKSST